MNCPHQGTQHWSQRAGVILMVTAATEPMTVSVVTTATLLSTGDTRHRCAGFSRKYHLFYFAQVWVQRPGLGKGYCLHCPRKKQTISDWRTEMRRAKKGELGHLCRQVQIHLEGDSGDTVKFRGIHTANHPPHLPPLPRWRDSHRRRTNSLHLLPG